MLACDHGLLGRVWQASIAWDNCVTSDHHGRPALPPLDPLWRPLVLALSEAIHLEVTAVTGRNGDLVISSALQRGVSWPVRRGPDLTRPRLTSNSHPSPLPFPYLAQSPGV